MARPVRGFAGNFLFGKVDFDLVDEVAGSLDEGSLVLAGPADDPEVAERLRATASQPNVVWIGGVEYDTLPSVVASFDVCLIPYLENDYTRSCFPLKLFEYLATGKPVVASGLPELTGYGAGRDRRLGLVRLPHRNRHGRRSRRSRGRRPPTGDSRVRTPGKAAPRGCCG